MGIQNIGIKTIGIHKPKAGIGISWSRWWASRSEVLFFGEVSKITDGKLYNQKSGATDYLTVGGAAGSYTFQCPNTAPYIAADTDKIWFSFEGIQRVPTEAELISYDFTRSIIKYGNTAPNSIEAIMILSSDVDTNKMRDDFNLSIWWDDTLSFHGSTKDNRGIGKSSWPIVLTTPTDLALTLISAGVQVDWTDVSGGLNTTEIWGQSDGAAYALLYTIDVGTITANDDAVTPVDLRYYKIRAKNGSNYSEFTDPVSIAMLGSERIANGTFDDATGWTTAGSGFTIHDGKLWRESAATGWCSCALATTTGEKYRFVCTTGDVVSTAWYATSAPTLSGGWIAVTAMTYKSYLTCSSGYTELIFRTGAAGGNYSIDNLSVKKILFP